MRVLLKPSLELMPLICWGGTQAPSHPAATAPRGPAQQRSAEPKLVTFPPKGRGGGARGAVCAQGAPKPAPLARAGSILHAPQCRTDLLLQNHSSQASDGRSRA